MPVTEKSRRRNGFCYRALGMGTGSIRVIMEQGGCLLQRSLGGGMGSVTEHLQ